MIDVVGTKSTIAVAVDSLCPGGRLVVVGYTPDSLSLSGKQIAQRELELIGSRCGPRTDLIETVDHVACGKIQSTVTSIQPLEQINDALALLQAGKSEGKIVISIS